MITFYVYKITNTLTGKIYIGKRITKTNYENDGYLGSGIILKHIREKYDKSVLKKEIIELCENEIQLAEREIYWIKFYNSTDINIGYNLTKGGVGGPTNTGRIFSQEWKDNISKSRKAQGNTINHIAAKLNPEYLKKQGESSKVAWKNPGLKEKRNKTCKLLKEQGLYRTRKGIKQPASAKQTISDKLSQKVKCENILDKTVVIYDSHTECHKSLKVAVRYYIDTDKLFKKKFRLTRYNETDNRSNNN